MTLVLDGCKWPVLHLPAFPWEKTASPQNPSDSSLDGPKAGLNMMVKRKISSPCPIVQPVA